MGGLLARYVFISSIRDDMLSDCKWHFKVLIIRLKCMPLLSLISFQCFGIRDHIFLHISQIS